MTATRPRPGLRTATPYAAPQLDVAVRLNTNECPYPLPAAFQEDLVIAVRELELHRYPDHEATALRAALAERTGHAHDGISVGNGSNEVIQQLLLAYGGPGRRAVVFEPTYGLHANLAWITNTELTPIRLQAPFRVTPDSVAAALAAGPDVVFVCSPNNPTGEARPLEVVEELATRSAALVIVDEAYIEFGGTSAADLIPAHPNVVVVRTFSKAFAMAGARLGYCLAAPEVVDDLRRVRLPYHLSAPAQAAGRIALRHVDEVAAILAAIRRERDRIVRALRGLDGVTPFPSDANFVLFGLTRPAGQVWAELLRHGVLVRDLSAVVPGCLRVTAGRPEEVDVFLTVLRDVLAGRTGGPA